MEVNQVPPPQPTRQLFSQPVQGMQKAQDGMQQAASKIAQGEVTPQNVTDMMSEQRVFEANAKVMKIYDEHVGNLLNILA